MLGSLKDIKDIKKDIKADMMVMTDQHQTITSKSKLHAF